MESDIDGCGGWTRPQSRPHSLAVRLVQVIALPFDLKGHRVTVGASVGIALSGDHGAAVDTLLRHADEALYRSKSAGRGTYCLFEPENNLPLQAQPHRIDSVE